MAKLSAFTIVVAILIAITMVQIFLLRWLFRITERLDEAKKTNELLQQILDQKKP